MQLGVDVELRGLAFALFLAQAAGIACANKGKEVWICIVGQIAFFNEEPVLVRLDFVDPPVAFLVGARNQQSDVSVAENVGIETGEIRFSLILHVAIHIAEVSTPTEHANIEGVRGGETNDTANTAFYICRRRRFDHLNRIIEVRRKDGENALAFGI